jgi:hypothetical protein
VVNEMVKKLTACPHCGQPMRPVREGVPLTPLKARIFDLIKARPGITRKELSWLLYESVTQGRLFTVGSHVKQIRDKYLATDLVIKASPYSGYTIRKRKA